MTRLPSDKITSLGPDYKEWPREFWGTEDVERARAEDRARAALKASLAMPKAILPLAMPPISDVSAFRLHPEPRPLRDAPARDLDERLFKAMEPPR